MSWRSIDAAALMVAPTSASSSVMFMPKQASDITNGIEVVKPPPGLRSVASATATPCSISIRAGAKRPSFRKNAADGSSVATTFFSREHPRVRFVDEDQVIGRPRADFGGDARPAAQRELVGVDARLQPVALAGLEDVARFVGREHALLAEHVAPLGEPLVGDRRDHLVDDLAARSRAGRPRNSTGTSCAPMNVAVSSIGWPAATVLIARSIFCSDVEVEAVAALRLGGGRAEATASPPAACARAVDQVVLAGHARRVDGLDDAAAGGGDVGIGRAGQPAPQLVAPIAGEDEMGVRIDEAGDHGAAARVDHLRLRRRASPRRRRRPPSRRRRCGLRSRRPTAFGDRARCRAARSRAAARDPRRSRPGRRCRSGSRRSLRISDQDQGSGTR